MEFYYYEGDQRRGPVNAEQLKAMAKNGIITPDTIIESGGKRLPASKIVGLVFYAPPQKKPSDPKSNQPSVDQSLVESYGQDLIAGCAFLGKFSKFLFGLSIVAVVAALAVGASGKPGAEAAVVSSVIGAVTVFVYSVLVGWASSLGFYLMAKNGDLQRRKE